MIVDIRLTAAQVEQAKRWAAEVERNRRRYANYTGLEAQNRYQTGYLGELVVGEWLTQNEVKHRHHVQTDGNSQGSEFIVMADDGTDHRVEVKTSNGRHHREFLFAVAQKKDFDLVIGVRMISEVDGQIMGWFTRTELLALPTKMVRIEDYWSAYSAMKAPGALLNLFKHAVWWEQSDWAATVPVHLRTRDTRVWWPRGMERPDKPVCGRCNGGGCRLCDYFGFMMGAS